MIEGIEHFCPHLEGLSLVDFELFGERRIQVTDAIATQSGEVAGRVARNIVTGIAKAILIQNTPSCDRRVAIAQASGKLRASHVRALIAIDQQSGSIVETQWLAGLQSNHIVQCPASHNRIQYGIHAAPNPAVSAERQVENDGRRQPVRGVVGTERVLGSEIVEHLRVVVLEIPQPGVPSCRRIIGGFGEGVIAFEADVMARSLLEPNL